MGLWDTGATHVGFSTKNEKHETSIAIREQIKKSTRRFLRLLTFVNAAKVHKNTCLKIPRIEYHFVSRTSIVDICFHNVGFLDTPSFPLFGVTRWGHLFI